MMKSGIETTEFNGKPSTHEAAVASNMVSQLNSVEAQPDRSKKNAADDSGNATCKTNTGNGHVQTDHPTSYTETLMHLLKGNIGAGVFGMGDAFKNGGIIFSVFLTVTLGVVCVHAQHILLKCARKMRDKHEKSTADSPDPDFAETVEMCIVNGPPKIRPLSAFVKLLVNIFICVTQLGFCCVYCVFIATNFKQIWLYIYGDDFNIYLRLALILLPVIFTCLITNLKYLAPCSTIANIAMGSGMAFTFYYAFQDMPKLSERRYFGDITDLPLYFGTAVYAFEGIALVLPLKNAMRKPKSFDRGAGVLNVGMVFITILFTSFGFFGYLKWGESVAGSLTLNLPQDEPFAHVVKFMVSIGMLLTFPLQFFVAFQIMWSNAQERIGPMKHPLVWELVSRTILVVFIYAVSELVPKLNLFISLIGALCSTTLALVFPPVIELICDWGESKGPSPWVLLKNFFILTVAVFGITTGTYESVTALSAAFFHK